MAGYFQSTFGFVLHFFICCGFENFHIGIEPKLFGASKLHLFKKIVCIFQPFHFITIFTKTIEFVETLKTKSQRPSTAKRIAQF